ncbi:MAG: peptidoglycan DD-metalloendopeptidase family protein [Paludibacter sp.]|jgi:murein hydrolase activator
MIKQRLNRFLILAVSLIMAISSLTAQSVKELEIQRKQALQRLEMTSKMLNETKKSQKSSLNKLSIISKNINDRKTLIKNIGTEIGKLDQQIGQLNQEKVRLEGNLKALKADYARLVQEAHINRSLYSKIMFVLSAKSFDQSYRRLRYLQEYSDYRKEQVRKIEGVKIQIEHKNDSLQVHKVTKVQVVKQKVTETQNLSKDQQKEKVLLTDLQKKEKKLRDDLKVQQKKAAELNNKIERLIAEEIRKAEAKRAAAEKKRLAEEHATEKKLTAEEVKTPKTSSKKEPKTSVEASKSVSNSSVSLLTKEETLLSGNFEKNQGRLPWPTSNGFISGHFGIHEHPVLKHVTTNNKGIYVQTPIGSSARAVFEGIVTQRFSIPGSNNAVIIQHGNYRTVYANLTQIFVREGDHVSAKQAIGKIYTDDERDNKTELYFQVWYGKTLQNPESWIAR